jgi:hypothetical protein
MFHVGQLVVCIRDIHVIVAHECLVSAPKKGDIVTVRETFLGTYGVPAITLEEHLNKVASNGEPGFRESNFRPIAKTDISIFTAMLSPTKVDA